MIISFILPTLTLTGGVRVVFEYASRLQDRGHQVYIIAPIIPPYLTQHIKRIDIKTAIKRYKRTYPLVMNENRRLKIMRVPFLSPRILNRVLPNGDAVIATGWETAYPVSKISEEKGQRFYFVQHYEIWDIWNNTECWRQVEQIEKDPSKYPLAMADVVPKDPYLAKVKRLVDNTYKLPLKKITVSSWLKELITKKFKSSVEEVIINGVDLDKFYCNKDKDWYSDRIRILMPYRGIPWKGDIDGLKALKKVKEAYKNVEVILYGSVRPSNLPSWIRVYEYPSDEELRQLYCSAHIFVAPSWVEGFYLPPMEAMACKCAVVTTNVGAIPDYTIPNKTAIVVPPRSPKKLAKAVMYLIEKPGYARKIANAGYEHIKQFTWDKAVQKLEQVLSGDHSDV